MAYARNRIVLANKLFEESDSRWKNVKREIDADRREAALKIKDDTYKKRKEFELEVKRDRLELERLQNKLNSKYEAIEKKEENIDELRWELQQKERDISRSEDTLRVNSAKLKNLYSELITKLERASNMTQGEARTTLLDTLQAEVKLSNQKWIQRTEEETKQIAKEKATSIVVTAMQRYTAQQVTPHSSSVVGSEFQDQ